ncbi:stemmadenine O-acetyltransferase-like [Magnolia sinica]|uniref:stemmadenine O-acetyltransferase-like n=1 Tax=Magnolia sinica TaxID=86752 RepID=UPI00265B3E36|nr:stemmadenine O-acetyltransferase-like [Magnolia sinica]
MRASTFSKPKSRVDRLFEFLQQPDVDALNQFLPCGYDFARPTKDMLLAIQFTVFECGGIRRSDCSDKEVSINTQNIAKLRARAPGDLRPTRVEAATALIWRIIMKAQRKPGTVRASIPLLPVSLRSRMVPLLLDHSFGNLCVDAVSSWVSDGECNDDLQLCLERLLRYSIRKIGREYIAELRGRDGLIKAFEKYSKCSMDICCFTSHCRFPYYEADFGWGRPIWISSANIPFKNLIILMGRR